MFHAGAAAMVAGFGAAAVAMGAEAQGRAFAFVAELDFHNIAGVAVAGMLFMALDIPSAAAIFVLAGAKAVAVAVFAPI